MRVRVIGATVMDDMEGVCDYGECGYVVYVCMIPGVLLPPLLHPLGMTDSLLGTIASFVLQQIRLLRAVQI